MVRVLCGTIGRPSVGRAGVAASGAGGGLSEEHNSTEVPAMSSTTLSRTLIGFAVFAVAFLIGHAQTRVAQAR